MKSLFVNAALALLVAGCAHDFFQRSSISSISKELQSDKTLTSYYDERVNIFFSQY